MSRKKEDYAESSGEQSGIVNCECCGNEIYQCGSCKNYFYPEEAVYCCKDQVGHICESCYEDLTEELPPKRGGR
jgi:hypothetical protein